MKSVNGGRTGESDLTLGVNYSVAKALGNSHERGPGLLFPDAIAQSGRSRSPLKARRSPGALRRRVGLFRWLLGLRQGALHFSDRLASPHLRGDHSAGLPWLLATRIWSRARRQDRVRLLPPEGVRYRSPNDRGHGSVARVMRASRTGTRLVPAWGSAERKSVEPMAALGWRALWSSRRRALRSASMPRSMMSTRTRSRESG